MSFMVTYKDEQGMVRAWGLGPTQEDAEQAAAHQLEIYKEEKRKVGDPLADANFRKSAYPVMDRFAEQLGGADV